MNPKRIFVLPWLIGLMLLCVCEGALANGLEKGIKLFKEGKYKEAKVSLRSYFKDSSDDSEAAYYLSTIYLYEGKNTESISWSKRAVKLDASNSMYYLRLGQGYGNKAKGAGIFKKLSLAKKTKKYFLKAVELDPKNIEARRCLLQYYLYAPGFAGGSNKQALNQAEQIFKLNTIEGHNAFIEIHNYKKDYVKVEEELRKLITLEPENKQFYFNLSYFYQNQKEYGKAEETIFKILRFSPGDLAVSYQIGRNFLLAGKNLEKGILYFEAYLGQDPGKGQPTWADAHWRLGMIYEKIGDSAQAILEYKRALKLNPHHKFAGGALKKFNN